MHCSVKMEQKKSPAAIVQYTVSYRQKSQKKFYLSCVAKKFYFGRTRKKIEKDIFFFWKISYLFELPKVFSLRSYIMADTMKSKYF